MHAIQAWIFWGGCGGGGGGGCAPPRNDLHPPEAFGTAPKSFCTPANYIYFDLIVSYLIILTTKFVKLPILWSQISPCRPRKQILLNFFRALPPRPGQSKQQHPPPRYLSTPPNENMKIRLWYENVHRLKIFIKLQLLRNLIYRNCLGFRWKCPIIPSITYF